MTESAIFVTELYTHSLLIPRRFRLAGSRQLNVVSVPRLNHCQMLWVFVTDCLLKPARSWNEKCLGSVIIEMNSYVKQVATHLVASARLRVAFCASFP
jgi:hypothetical protein